MIEESLELTVANAKDKLTMLFYRINERINTRAIDEGEFLDFRIHYAELFFNGKATIFKHEEMNNRAKWRKIWFLDKNDSVQWHANQPEENFQSIGNMRFFSNMETFFDNL